jgi:hypothetical protein
MYVQDIFISHLAIHFVSDMHKRFASTLTMSFMKGFDLQLPENPATMQKTKTEPLKYHYHN